MAKTKGVKSCTPGNVKCGGRCIPQSWDCRLRGEGQDKALKASRGLDPLGSLAQIQRGGTRVLKGISKGNFSEIEGGRRQIIRTVSRNSKGEGGRELTLKEKKEVQDRLVQGTMILGTAAAVLSGGFVAHRTLMRAPTYRARIGNSINNTINDTQNRLLDSIPLSGNRRTANANTARGAGSRALRLTTPNASSNRAQVLGGAAQPPSGATSELVGKLTRLKVRSGAPATEIEAESLKTYLGAKRGQVNVHAESAAMETISRAYGMELPKTGKLVDNKKTLMTGMEKVISAERAAVRSDLQQRGYTISNPESRAQYLDNIFPDAMAREHASKLLGSTQPSSVARGIYESQVSGWSNFYDSMAESIGSDLGRLGRGKAVLADQNDVIQIARVKHAEFLDRNMPTGTAGGRINRLEGASTQDAVMKLTALEFHARKNAPRAEWTAPKALVNKAAQEVGITTPTMTDTYMELSKKFIGLRGEVQFPVGVTRQAKDIVVNKGFSDQEAILNIFNRLRKERKTKVSSIELMRQAVAEHERSKKRRDSERTDFTSPGDRAGQPCGKSFIPKSQKCSRPTTARYAEKPQPTKKGSGGSTQKKEGDNTLGKVLGGTALAAGAAVVGGAAAFKNRKKIGLYAGNSKSIAQGMNAAIVRMNQKDVKNGIAKLPKQWQQGASSLLGKAKAAAAYVAADVQGFEIKNVDNKNNFTTWSTPDKSRVMNIGSVDDTLMVFNAKQTGKAALRTENGKSVPIYDMDFTADLGFQQKEGVSRQSGMATVKMVKAMNQATIPELGNNALLKNVPYAKDGKGDRRASLYKRAGYRELQGQRGTAQWAMLNNGKVEQIPDGYDAFFDALIRGKSYDEAAKAMQRGDSLEPLLEFFKHAIS